MPRAEAAIGTSPRPFNGTRKGPRPSTTEAGPSSDDFGETKGAAVGKGAWPSTTQAAPPPCHGDDGKALKDGGGLCSALDWQVPPPSAVGDPLQPVRQALWKALPQDSLARMKSVMHSGSTCLQVDLTLLGCSTA